MRTLSLCCVSFLLLAAAARPASADGPAPVPLPESLASTGRDAPAPLPLDDWERLHDLPAGTELRVSAERARVLKGKLVTVTNEALTIRPPTARRQIVSVPSRTVVRIHRVHRDPITNGALLGLAGGAGVGAAVGAIVGVSAPESDETLRGRIFTTPLGLMIGAGAGAATGAIVDSVRVDLELVYERKP